MIARRAARELALLAFSQLSKNVEKWQNQDIEEIIVLSVRTLVDEAENNLKTATTALFDIREFIENYEADHPTNIQRPLGVSNIPVPIPLTSDMIGRIDVLIDSADKTFSALEIAEISALSEKKDVKEYISKLIQLFTQNKQEVDNQISSYSKGWNIERLVKIDRDILRIAITELLFIQDIPISTSIDEAVELAKKFSSEESSSFINGILGEVVKQNDLYKTKK